MGSETSGVVEMKCPECNSKEIIVIGTKMSESEELYEVNIYGCRDCNCEFDSEEGN